MSDSTIKVEPKMFIVRAAPKVGGCDHKMQTMIVDERNISIECGGCRERIDPFKVVMFFMDKEWLRHRREEADEAVLLKRIEKQKGTALQTLIKHGVTPAIYEKLYKGE